MLQLTIKTRWLLNLVLAALVLGLVALVYFRPAAKPPAGPPLTALQADAITSIRLERGAAVIVLQRSASGWRLQAPLAARANQFNIDSLLRVASATSGFQTPADSSTLASYGLDKPAVRLHLNDEVIAVGALHPMHQQHYVHYRDSVHLIPSYTLAAAFQHYTAFIDTRLLEEGRRLGELRLPDLHLLPHDGSWRREPPDPDRQSSADRLNEFVADWENARALSVEKLAPRPALARIQLVFEVDGKPETLALEILAYKPEFILARHDEGLEYHFPEEVGKRLLAIRADE